MDDSGLDAKYFVSGDCFNCPFCKRRNVRFEAAHLGSFDWTADKRCEIFLAECVSCNNVSMHLSYGDVQEARGELFPSEEKELDDCFFISIPSSFFVLDTRIPRVLRELFAESEGCLKGNYLTGASACARKVVYELARLESAEGENYEDRIRSLKDRLPDVDPSYFDALLAIQQATSSKVHENAYDGWSGGHLKTILAALREILWDIYVIPEERKARRARINDLKREVVPVNKDRRAKE